MVNKTNEVDGRIVCITLKNFLTYDDCQFMPGENLNVILGPNGTGKSSIVCAICLGLGGQPGLLGRAKDVGDYVKHYTSQAKIEIELFKSKGVNLIITRVINKMSTSKNKEGVASRSLWYINKKESSKESVLEVVGKLNIQMTNLCQFLPQDKVAEFAKMSPQQLLEATEKAVGPPGMHGDHQDLIKMSGLHRKKESSRAEKMQVKEHIEQRNSLLEGDVRRYHERQKHQVKLKNLKMKKPWVEYNTVRSKFYEAKKDKSALDSQLKDARKQGKPIEKEITKHNDELKKLDENIHKLAVKSNLTAKDMKQVKEKFMREAEKVDDIRSELQNIQDGEKQRQKRIAKFQRDIAALQKEVEQSPDPEGLKPRRNEIQENIKQLTMKFNRVRREKDEWLSEANQQKASLTTFKEKLCKLESVDNWKLESLRKVDRAAYDVVLWLRENQHRFTATVYEPIMTQINMKNIQDAVFLESTVSLNDFKAFVCENIDDQALFSDLVHDNLKLDVTVVCPPSDAKNEYQPNLPLQHLAKYGFESYLPDLFDCPNKIMQYLCENYHLHNIPIGNANTESKANEVINNVSGFKLFFTPSSAYRISKSKYSGQTISNVSFIKSSPTLLNKSVDVDEIKHLKVLMQSHTKSYNECNTKYDQAVKEVEALSIQLKEEQKQRQQVESQMKVRAILLSQIKTKEKRLSSEMSESPDIDKQKEAASLEINQLNVFRVGKAKQYSQFTILCVELAKERLTHELKQVQLKEAVRKAEGRLQEISESLKSLEEAQTLVNRRCLDLKHQAKALLKIAQEASGIQISDGSIPEELKTVFDSLPNSVEEIEACIHDEQARLDCQFPTDSQVVKDYEKNKTEIENLSEAIEKDANEMQSLQSEIGDLLKRWLTPLERLVERIDTQFSDFFRRMGCAGRIALEKDPDNDYNKFGIAIQVKFRAENRLKALTSNFQSGGERSVSTMLYLMSLQELTKCPFRLVDEINQGMDPSNERRVFELVVETVCRPDSSQYFLVTPKLLPDLHYTDRMTILTVLNGHWMIPHEKYNVRDFLDAKRKRNKAGK